jgi:hypothetical protein
MQGAMGTTVFGLIPTLAWNAKEAFTLANLNGSYSLVCAKKRTVRSRPIFSHALC